MTNENKKPYRSFRDASDSNWALAKQLWGNHPNIKLINPESLFGRKNPCFDAILQGSKTIILQEIKRRNVTFEHITSVWESEVVLEKSKWTAMNKMRKKLQKNHPQKDIRMHYLNKTSDGILLLWDITTNPGGWHKRIMNHHTYSNRVDGSDLHKTEKVVTMLPLMTARLQKTNIID